MARTLITGASGLIGSAVVRNWPTGRDLVAVGSHDVDLLAPGAPAALVDQVRPECVLHLAWCASGTADYRVNPDNDRWVDASLALARAARDRGARFFGTGTMIDDTEPADAYGASKRRLRQELSPAIQAGDITWLRPFHVFDLTRRSPALVASALAACESARPMSLLTPEAAHDFVLAEDVGRGVVAAVDGDLRGVVELGSGTLRRVRDLVERLGASWSGPADAPATRSAVADLRPLGALGWRPSSTEDFFGDG